MIRKIRVCLVCTWCYKTLLTDLRTESWERERLEWIKIKGDKKRELDIKK